LLFAVGVAVAGYWNRNKIGGWLGRLLYRTPPAPVEPAWEIRRTAKYQFRLINSGVGTPRSVRISADQDDVYLRGIQGWEEFPPGFESDEIDMEQTVGEPNLDCTISWHVEDRNEPSGWRRVEEARMLPLDRWW
jgi:hypothetical protein